MEQARNIKYKVLCFTALAVITAIVYFPALWHIARSEQNLYLYETADIQTRKI